MNMRDAPSSTGGVKAAVGLFMSACVASYLYCAVTGTFNGDYFPQTITLDQVELFKCLLWTLLPYVACWYAYRSIRVMKPAQRAVISQRTLNRILMVGYAWFIGITMLFDVGVMTKDFYDAPALIKPLIQIGNRIDPFVLGVFYILASPKRARYDVAGAGAMVTLGLLRAGLGAFIYVLLALVVKYHHEIFRTVRRHLVAISLVLMAAPFAVSYLYDLRASLRGDAEIALAVTDIVLAKLAGRMSSYSNLAYLRQEQGTFEQAAGTLDQFYYLEQIGGSLLTADLAPEVTPEKLLINATRIYDGNSTYMAGVPGNALLSLNRSPVSFVFNLGLLVFLVTTILLLSERLGTGKARYLGMTMVLYPLTSGVSYEFSNLMTNIFFLVLLCMSLRPRNRRSATHRRLRGMHRVTAPGTSS